MKRLSVSLVSILLLTTIFNGFGNINNNQNPLNILVVFPASNLGEGGISGITKANEALDNLEVANPNQINITRVYPKMHEDGVSAITEGTNFEYDLIIAVDQLVSSGIYSSDRTSYSYAVSTGIGLNPEQRFLLLNGLARVNFGISLANTKSILYLEHEGSFLAGALAAMVSQNNTIGYYSESRFDDRNRYKFGFFQGINFISDKFGEKFVFLESYSDTVDSYNATVEFIQDGADIIYGAAGELNLGIFNAVSDYNSTRNINLDLGIVYAIGSDNDQDFVKPGLILTSMVKKIEIALTSEITKLINREWEGGEEFLGIEGGHLELSDMTFTQDEKFVVEEKLNGQTRDELIQYLETAIMSGEIIVSEDSTNAEINLKDNNPFNEKEENLIDQLAENQLLVGSLIFTIATVTAIFLLREQILRKLRKSEKSKAIDYLETARKIAEEPED